MTQEEIVKYINSLTAQVVANTKVYNEEMKKIDNSLKQIIGKLMER
jgi:hypothetical protein